MKRPATASIAVFVAVLVVTAVIVAAVGLGTDGATAIRVGSSSTSRETMNDELREWAGLQLDQVRTTAGAVDARAGATIATQIVLEDLANSYLDRVGEPVTSDDRRAAREQVQGARSTELSRWFQDRIVARQATFAALTRVVAEDDQGTAELRVLRREARRAGVTVDPVYGRWSPAMLTVAPIPPPAALATGA